MSDTFDTIVVGAGIEGSCAAYQLARNGYRTALLEQFYLPHSRGSSGGHSRIIRKAYEAEVYTQMMQESYDWWDTIERQVGKTMFINCKLVYCCLKEEEHIPKIMAKYGVKHKVYKNAAELMGEYPMFNFEDNGKHVFVLDEEAGTLRADNCLEGVQTLFKKHGGKLYDGSRVEEIVPGDVVTVKTKNKTFHAKNIIICAGPWSGKVLKPLGLNLPLKPVLISVAYWKENITGSCHIDKTPTFVCSGDRESKLKGHIYSLPCDEYPNHFKLVYHDGPEIDPDDRDVDPRKSDHIFRGLEEYVRQHFPTLEPRPSIVDKCTYTWTPDSNFILDTHPKWKNIVIGAGFSGHGFKMAPVVGRILMDLAVGRKPSYDMTTFSISRFEKKAKL